MLFRVFILASLFGLVSVGCSSCDGGGFPVDALSPDGRAAGTISLAWTITDLQGSQVSCEQVAANTVFLELKNRSGGVDDTISLSCASGQGTSQQLAAGIYDATFELHGFNTTVATATPQARIEVKAGQDTQLAPVTFQVDANGGLVLTLVAPPATSNCKSPAMGGAGITTTTITLVHTDDGCAPVTFTRTRGTMTLAPYIVNCSSPMVASCIENDEVLTVASMASGSYDIQVRGRVNSLDCWQNNDTLQVPPRGETLTVTLNLAFQATTAGCVRP